jgi:glycosyltransferase involved in cell wall biosynthesis
VTELSIAMLGTRGVPARYGGFETAVEEVGRRLAARGHTVRVYCRSGNSNVGRTYRGMELVTLPALRQRSLETLSHTGLSAFHLLTHRTDVALMFNAANAPWLPVLRAARVPVATHVDGLEWKRAKWGPTGRRYYRAAETASVRLSDALIADAQGISDYYSAEYGVPSTLISYGAPILTDVARDKLSTLGLEPLGFHLVVARFEPENHVDLVVEGYVASDAELPLVVVGSAPYADEYTARIRELAGADPRVRLVGGVWDQELLDQLYGNALTYLHGHSVGGTNPSLLRAIGAGTATIAFDVDFNREVLRADGEYFSTPADVVAAVTRAERDVDGEVARGKRLQGRACEYDWDEVADGYERLAQDLHTRSTPGRRRFARRRPEARDA